MRLLKNLFITTLFLLPIAVSAEPIRVAVASNFTHAMQEIVKHYEQESGHAVELVFGSTGKIYAQIINGAPFDAFFAADSDRPKRLEREQRIQPGSRFSYAIGQIVLWSPDKQRIHGPDSLNADDFRHLAIANPRLAPYGEAARQILQNNGVWEKLQGKIVQGENIAQTFHFVKSGNAELGFVALSQIKVLDKNETGSLWLVPADQHDPIEQQAVQLSDKSTVSAFLDYVKSDVAGQIIEDYGYRSP